MAMGMEKIKLKNNYIFLKIFKDIYETNSKDTPNIYEKRKVFQLISFAFGISDERSIKAKFNFALMTKILLPITYGYSINPNIIECYNNFVEKNKEFILTMDLAGNYEL